MAASIALASKLLYTQRVLCRLFFMIFFLISLDGAWAQEELPFWRRKIKLFTQILDQRRVVVSVETQNDRAGQKVRVSGVGVVKAPYGFTIQQVMNFQDLPEISSHFKKVVHRPKKQEVYFFMQALGYQVRFLQHYKWGVQSPGQSQLDWIVTWGTLKGMVGHYKFRKLPSGKTEIEIWASLKSAQLPIPQFLLNFTLEVIAEKVAQKMRTFIEQNYRKGVPAGDAEK